MNAWRCRWGMLAGLVLPAVLAAQTYTVRLPDAWCGGSDGLFADGFETGGVFSSDPSLGSGGAALGKVTGGFTSPSYGAQTYYLYLPPQYDPAQPAPLMVVLHGYAGSPFYASAAARTLRNAWITAADTYGFIIAAPVGNSPHGSWLVPGDYETIDLMLGDLAQDYNIERNRISIWGFSAGGHVVWDMVLNGGSNASPLDATNLAAMATSGANSQFACNNNPVTCGSRFAALQRKLPVDVHIGTNDPNYAWAADDQQRLLSSGWLAGDKLSFNIFVGGHTYTPAQVMQVGGFACRFAVQP